MKINRENTFHRFVGELAQYKFDIEKKESAEVVAKRMIGFVIKQDRALLREIERIFVDEELSFVESEKITLGEIHDTFKVIVDKINMLFEVNDGKKRCR